MLTELLSQVSDLQGRFPGWTVWRAGNGRWTGTRPRRGDEWAVGPQAEEISDCPGSVLVWRFADTHDGLAESMRKADGDDQ